MSQLLALVLAAGADVPSAPTLASELAAALGLASAPAVTVLGMENDDTLIFAFRGAGADRLARSFLALPAATLQRELHAVRAAPASSASGPSPPSPAGGGTPTWVVPVVVVLAVALAAVAAVMVVKRKAIFGTSAYAAEEEEGPVHSASAAELASGRVNTGGEYSRFEDLN
jgi:hypothetical protein